MIIMANNIVIQRYNDITVYLIKINNFGYFNDNSCLHVFEPEKLHNTENVESFRNV